MKHQVTLSTEELLALQTRLVPVSPSHYALGTYAILQKLYGRFGRILRKELKHGKKD